MIEKLQDHSNGYFFFTKFLITSKKKSTYKMYPMFFLLVINIFVFPPSVEKKRVEKLYYATIMIVM